jgi:hypothetical protein
VRKFAVSGRVIINAALFRENNLNYFFLSIDERLLKDNNDFNSEDISFGSNRVVIKGKAFYFSKKLILYSETVYGFCFLTKR